MRISGICPKHGYWKGETCPECEYEEKRAVTRPVFPFTDKKTFGDNREISSWKHFDKECKKKGLVVGTETPKGLSRREKQNEYKHILNKENKKRYHERRITL